MDMYVSAYRDSLWYPTPHIPYPEQQPTSDGQTMPFLRNASTCEESYPSSPKICSMVRDAKRREQKLGREHYLLGMLRQVGRRTRHRHAFAVVRHGWRDEFDFTCAWMLHGAVSSFNDKLETG